MSMAKLFWPNYPTFQLWHRPFLIIECIHKLMFRLRNYENGQPMPIPVHAQSLKRGITRQKIGDEFRKLVCIPDEVLPKDSWEQGEEQDTEGDHPMANDCHNNEYIIEKIIQAKYFGEEVHYLSGFVTKHNSYVNFEDLNESAKIFVKNNVLRTMDKPHKK